MIRLCPRKLKYDIFVYLFIIIKNNKTIFVPHERVACAFKTKSTIHGWHVDELFVFEGKKKMRKTVFLVTCRRRCSGNGGPRRRRRRQQVYVLASSRGITVPSGDVRSSTGIDVAGASFYRDVPDAPPDTRADVVVHQRCGLPREGEIRRRPADRPKWRLLAVGSQVPAPSSPGSAGGEGSIPLPLPQRRRADRLKCFVSRTVPRRVHRRVIRAGSRSVFRVSAFFSGKLRR